MPPRRQRKTQGQETRDCLDPSGFWYFFDPQAAKKYQMMILYTLWLRHIQGIVLYGQRRGFLRAKKYMETVRTA